MAEKDHRKMALQIAGLRANETHLPEGERVFHDPYAEFFFDKRTREYFHDTDLVRAERAKYERIMPGVNGAIVARVRFFDEYLIRRLHEGFQQVVILGAGYDTRAHRIGSLHGNARFFEVDHPITQARKLETVKGIFGDLPEYVVYVPVDFASDRPGPRLSARGYDPEAKTVFIAEGVIMYLLPATVDDLLEFIVNQSCPGSVLVADYFSTSVVDGTSPLPEARNLRKFVEAEDSPLQFGIAEGKLEEFFIQRGFQQPTRATPSECKEKYFRGESQNRTVSPMFHFVTVSTAPKQKSSI